MGKTIWSDEKSRKLLIILLDEKKKGTTKFQWPNITNMLNAQLGEIMTQTQVKNHHTDLRERFKCLEELKRMTGISFNPITKEVDVEERSLERWQAFLEKNKRYGKACTKGTIPNEDLLSQLFNGRIAVGVGGCFSPGMARGKSYLTNGLCDDDVLENESSGDNEEKDDSPNDLIIDHISNPYCESVSPPRSTLRKVSRNTSSKRKSESIIDSSERKRRETSFDGVVELLKGAFIGSSSGSSSSNAKLVSETLARMEVSAKRGDDFYVKAVMFLNDDKHAENFLLLENDNQKWIYLKQAEE